MKYIHYFYSLLISISYLPVWGLLFLDSETANSFSSFIGFAYTIISISYFKNLTIIGKSKYSKLLLCAFPAFYFLATAFFLPKNLVYFLNPIFWAFILLLISFIFLKLLDLREFFFILFISYLYAYHLYPIFKNQVDNKGFPTEEVEKKDLATNKNLKTYTFISNKMDTFKLSTTKKYFLIETWNETCQPCLAAMNDLQPLLDSLSPLVDHYYLYENGTNNKLDTVKVFNFHKINNKNKIIFNNNSLFYNDLQMQSFPYFLLFDEKGNLVDYFKGYSSNNKDYFKNRIRKMIDTR